MFGITKSEPLEQAQDIMKQRSVKYPCRNKDGTIEYVYLWELTEEYKRNQIRFHKNRIEQSQYLLSLLQ